MLPMNNEIKVDEIKVTVKHLYFNGRYDGCTIIILRNDTFEFTVGAKTERKAFQLLKARIQSQVDDLHQIREFPNLPLFLGIHKTGARKEEALQAYQKILKTMESIEEEKS